MRTLGIILAAGRSSRLFPATLVTTKQVLPIYDKPLIYYPLSTLMLAGVREFLVICNPKEKPIFEELFYDSENTLGIKINIAVQEYPAGIADAFNIVNELALPAYARYALVLGDNIFYGAGMSELLYEANDVGDYAYCFVTKVHDPERFGVAEIDQVNRVLSLEEKPSEPKSDLAVTGLYFFPPDVLDRIRNLQPSARGELEITDLLKTYMGKNLIGVRLWRGVVWFDTGTPDSMIEASNFVQTIQKHQEVLVGSPHEIAYNKHWINTHELKTTAMLCGKSAYGKLLNELVDD
jgi:glucose-1-phosphate thymidylyltransferase